MSTGRDLAARGPGPGSGQHPAPVPFADGRYELRELLAAGAKAEVYTAHHRSTGKSVVVKVVAKSRRGEREAERRLVREGLALRRARHPGIVQILDSGMHGGSPFVALEQLSGRSLAGLLAARGRFSTHEVIGLGLRLTEILGDAHVTGVLHRDLKPGHVFCIQGGGIKVIDFGSARVPELFETEETAGLTAHGVPVGTPEYMAPESLNGETDALGRGDIYALGVVLFELLTGSVPYSGTLPQVILAQAKGTLPSLERLRLDVPAALRTTIERCLALTLDERYTSMADLAVDLELARDFPAVVSSRHPTTSHRLSLAGPPIISMIKPLGPEARRFARAPYTTPAVLTTGRGEVVSGRVEEISEGGAQFMAEARLEVGATGKLKFSLPLRGKTSIVGAKVQWTRAGRVTLHAFGLELDGLEPEAAAQIRKYVQLMQGNAAALTG